jgi:osmotically-inducible protein OsmY
MVTSKKLFLVGSTAIVLSLGLIACDDKTSAQTVGKSIDNAAEKTADTIKDTSQAVGDTTVKMGDALADSTITTKVKAVILAEPGLKSLKIGVETVDNVTTLTGSVDTKLNSKKAEEITKAVDGVKSVDNQLMVATSK